MRLSPRELEVAALVARGLTNKQISRELALSIGTVKHYVHHILVKTGAQNRTAAAVMLISKNGGQRPE